MNLTINILLRLIKYFQDSLKYQPVSASEVDEKLFWKMLKKGKGKGQTMCFLVYGKFGKDVTNMWADHSETLGQPTIDDSCNENFRIKVESAVEQIFAEWVSTLSATEPLFIYDTVKEVCQGLKCGIAGPDMTTCERLKYGGGTCPMGYSLQIILVSICLMRCSLTIKNILYSSFI